MTEDHFRTQVARLKNQWPNSYGPERIARIWVLYREVENSFFTEMVDVAIDEWRTSPLVADLSKIEQRVKERKSQERNYNGMRDAGVSDVLNRAGNREQLADKDLVAACRKLLQQKNEGKITREQFYEACKDIEKLANVINPPKGSRSVPGTSRNDFISD